MAVAVDQDYFKELESLMHTFPRNWMMRCRRQKVNDNLVKQPINDGNVVAHSHWFRFIGSFRN